MDFQRILNEAAIAFGIGTIKQTTPATKGLGNANYFVSTHKGEFVLRILKTQTLEGLQNEVSIEEQLGLAGVPTPNLLPGPESKYYVELEGKYVTCSKRLEGEHPKFATEKISREIGTTLAKFHQAVIHLPSEGNSWLIPEAVRRELNQLPEDSFGSEIRTQIENSFEILDADLPRGFIHGDLHFSNLLVTKENKIAVFDFEEAGQNVLILDLAMSAVSLYDHNETAGKELLISLIDGYELVRQLTPKEKENLSKAILCASGVMAAWLYNNEHAQYARESVQLAKRIVDLIG